MEDAGGTKHETWFDGSRPYVQVGDPPKFVPGFKSTSGDQSSRNYFGNEESFPDVEWVTPKTYLGVEKSSGYWVFQQSSNGALFWVNPATRFPVRWTKNGQVRVFQLLPAPTQPLTLPSAVVRTSQELKHLEDLSRVAPAGL
jgi:hypothetical protein